MGFGFGGWGQSTVSCPSAIKLNRLLSTVFLPCIPISTCLDNSNHFDIGRVNSLKKQNKKQKNMCA